MLDNTILTIAIPTFNRQNLLERTLRSLAPLSNISNVQILVIDNCSNDGTWEWLCREKDSLGITIQQNTVNLGVEGNIIQALLQAKGDYVWLLSDHMNVNATEVIIFIGKLKAGLEFTFGYARTAQYASVLPESYIPVQLKKLNQYSLSEIILCMGNISTFIVNGNYLRQCVRTIFRFSSYTFPHLGVFVHAKENTMFVELPTVSNFILPLDKTKPKRNYNDTFRSRFIGFVRAVDEIRRLNPKLKHIHGALKTPRVIRALFTDAISRLCFSTSNSIKPSEFLFCLRRYPGKIRLFLLGCTLLSVFPVKTRLLICRMILGTLFPNRYQRAAQSYKLRLNCEIIKDIKE